LRVTLKLFSFTFVPLAPNSGYTESVQRIKRHVLVVCLASLLRLMESKNQEYKRITWFYAHICHFLFTHARLHYTYSLEK